MRSKYRKKENKKRMAGSGKMITRGGRKEKKREGASNFSPGGPIK